MYHFYFAIQASHACADHLSQAVLPVLSSRECTRTFLQLSIAPPYDLRQAAEQAAGLVAVARGISRAGLTAYVGRRIACRVSSSLPVVGTS